MISLAICDDETDVVGGLGKALSAYYNTEATVNVFTSCEDLLMHTEFYEMPYDIIIMDVMFPEGDGIEAIKRIQNQFPQTEVIYLTGYIETSKRIFQTRPSNFLVKPVKIQEVIAAIDKIMAARKNSAAESFVINVNEHRSIRVSLKDVVYFESKGHKVFIHLENETYQIYRKLDLIEEQLDGKFLRIHKSYLINMLYIVSMKSTDVTLRTGTELPISRSNRENVRKTYTSYMKGLLWE